MMSDALSHTDRHRSELAPTELRDIQRELAEMRDDRTVMVAMLTRHDASIDGISVELRALRSQFDRFRAEMRERSVEIEGRIDALANLIQARFDRLEAGLTPRLDHLLDLLEMQSSKQP